MSLKSGGAQKSEGAQCKAGCSFEHREVSNSYGRLGLSTTGTLAVVR